MFNEISGNDNIISFEDYTPMDNLQLIESVEEYTTLIMSNEGWIYASSQYNDNNNVSTEALFDGLILGLNKLFFNIFNNIGAALTRLTHAFTDTVYKIDNVIAHTFKLMGSKTASFAIDYTKNNDFSRFRALPIANLKLHMVNVCTNAKAMFDSLNKFYEKFNDGDIDSKKIESMIFKLEEYSQTFKNAMNFESKMHITASADMVILIHYLKNTGLSFVFTYLSTGIPGVLGQSVFGDARSDMVGKGKSKKLFEYFSQKIEKNSLKADDISTGLRNSDKALKPGIEKIAKLANENVKLINTSYKLLTNEVMKYEKLVEDLAEYIRKSENE